MARNIEIKASLGDSFVVQQKIKAIASSGSEILLQKDIFYKAPFGRLKLRQINSSQSEIIYYIRPNHKGPKTSNYYRIKVSHPNLVNKILSFALGVTGVVEKRREVFFIDRTRVHIDCVNSLGNFIELEVVLRPDESIENGRRVANELVDFLDLRKNTLIEKSYLELMRLT